jgi:hypothetical protein
MFRFIIRDRETTRCFKDYKAASGRLGSRRILDGPVSDPMSDEPPPKKPTKPAAPRREQLGCACSPRGEAVGGCPCCHAPGTAAACGAGTSQGPLGTSARATDAGAHCNGRSPLAGRQMPRSLGCVAAPLKTAAKTSAGRGSMHGCFHRASRSRMQRMMQSGTKLPSGCVGIVRYILTNTARSTRDRVRTIRCSLSRGRVLG